MTHAVVNKVDQILELSFSLEQIGFLCQHHLRASFGETLFSADNVLPKGGQLRNPSFAKQPRFSSTMARSGSYAQQKRVRVPVVTAAGNTTVELVQVNLAASDTQNPDASYVESNSKSLEQRVDKIETLLKQLIKVQNRKAVTVIRKDPAVVPAPDDRLSVGHARKPIRLAVPVPNHRNSAEDNDRVYVVHENNGVISAIDQQTHKLLWQTKANFL
ncbi:MAG: hypothetical protein IH899_16185, partial [Planctomycetes bacterium]|nr:hypothetical protein [Planctomycetota bacterium]